MKTLLTAICVLLLLSTAGLFADGIPVDHETGKVTVPHTLVKLSSEQIEEIIPEAAIQQHSQALDGSVPTLA